MAKSSGLGHQLWVDGYDLGGDIGSPVTIAGGNGPLDVTPITASAHERIGGIRDGRIEFTSYFNPSTDRAHERFSALPTTDVIVTYAAGTTLGDEAASVVAKQINYDGTRAEDGAFTFAVAAQANGFGLQWGSLGTAGIRTDSGATDGSSVDFGTGSTSFGLQAFLHVFSFTGTDATVTIEESSDDGAGDAFAAVTGGAFTQITTGPTSERIATSTTQTVERYLRVATSTSAGFSDLQFAVVITRPDTATTF